jgi:hypothetical protein
MTTFKAIAIAIGTWLASGATWAALRGTIIELLKVAWVRTILLQIFGAAISGGYQAWIAKLIVEYAFDTLALPIIQLAFRKMGYVYHREEGKIIFTRMEEAKRDNDKVKYDSAVDDLFRHP